MFFIKSLGVIAMEKGILSWMLKYVYSQICVCYNMYFYTLDGFLKCISYWRILWQELSDCVPELYNDWLLHWKHSLPEDVDYTSWGTADTGFGIKETGWLSLFVTIATYGLSNLGQDKLLTLSEL